MGAGRQRSKVSLVWSPSGAQKTREGATSWPAVPGLHIISSLSIFESAVKQSGTSGRRGADLRPMIWTVPANLQARELFHLYQTRFFQTLALPKPLYDHVIVHLIMMCRRRDATSPIGRTNPSSSEAELADERSKSTISC